MKQLTLSFPVNANFSADGYGLVRAESWLGDVLRLCRTGEIAHVTDKKLIENLSRSEREAFERIFGCGIKEFLRRVRVRHSLGYLTGSRGTVAQAAQEGGFADSSHFIKATRSVSAARRGSSNGEPVLEEATVTTPGGLVSTIRGSRRVIFSVLGDPLSGHAGRPAVYRASGFVGACDRGLGAEARLDASGSTTTLLECNCP